MTEVVDVVDPLGNWSKAAAKLSVLSGQEGEEARVAHINCCQCLNGNFLSFNACSLSLSLWLLVLARPGTRYGLVCLSQTDTQTEGAGWEKFAYQAALNINIARPRGRG